MGRLEGRKALVTGSSRGIGRAIAIALAAEGADVAVNYRERSDQAAAVAAEIEALGRRACAIQGDVSDPAQAAALVASALKEMGGLDVLVNNCGISGDGLICDLTHADWSRVLGTNFLGAVNCTRAALDHFMESRRGVVVNISSVAADRSWVGNAAYASSKAALDAFTRSAALELARFGVRVAGVAPAFCPTDMVEAQMKRRGEKLRRQIPLRNFSRPEDIAAVVVFLVSDDAAQITGEIIRVDGGVSAGMPVD